MGTLITLTSNGDVNLMIAQRALEEFSPPKVLAIFPNNNEENNLKTNKQKINQAFVAEFSLKTWNQYLVDGQFKLGKTIIKSNTLDLQQIHLQTMINSGELLPLLMKRKGKLEILTAGEEWTIGDEIIYLLHDSRPDLLKRLSGTMQSSRFSLNQLPEVEEIPLI